MAIVLRADDGNVALLTALTLPVALALAGAAVDYSRYASSKSGLQAFADALALRGAKELSLSGANQASIAHVVEAAASGGLADDMKVGDFTLGVAVDMRDVSVTVTLRQPAMRTLLLGGVSPYGDEIVVRSTAVSRGGTNLCMLALNRVSDGAFDAAVASKVEATQCALVSNSASTLGVRASGTSRIAASQICTAGGYAGASTAFAPPPLTDCPDVPDPLSSRAAPAFGGCDYVGKMVGDRSQKTVLSALTASFYELTGSSSGAMTRTPYTLNPGVYCGGLTIGANASATLNPGVYVIKDGPLTVDLNGEIKGANVGFFLAGATSTFTFGPDSKIDLSAPKDGPLAGILFFEDPAAPAGRSHSILSNDARNLLGTFYLPKGTLYISTISPIADRSAYTAIVADRIRLVGSPTLVLNADYGMTDVPVPKGVGPIGAEIFLRN